MSKFLEKLIDIGGNPLSSDVPRQDENSLDTVDEKVGDLVALLGEKNGFYAFESALHVFPYRSFDVEMGLLEWNASGLWVNEYRGMASEAVFFAEDIFGGQFCIKQDGIFSFDPETAIFEHLAPNLDRWAKLIMEDYEYLTGYPLAHKWQQSQGILASGKRLIPKVPFVMGGDFSVDNLYAIDAVKAMRFRANLAIQIKELPDGAPIQWRLED